MRCGGRVDWRRAGHGLHELAGLPRIPANVRVVEEVPLNMLLPTCDAIVLKLVARRATSSGPTTGTRAA